MWLDSDQLYIEGRFWWSCVEHGNCIFQPETEITQRPFVATLGVHELFPGSQAWVMNLLADFSLPRLTPYYAAHHATRCCRGIQCEASIPRCGASKPFGNVFRY